MNSKGFVLYAKGLDYIIQSCLCAMSIKVTGNKYPISIITNDIVPAEYIGLFDKIIPIPWDDNDTTYYQINNRWKIYHASPYESTIVLDTDVLVLQDIETYWNFLENYNLYFVSNVLSYKRNIITDNYYRKAFYYNNLPNIYSGIYFFKKCEFTHTFFKWLELVSNNWQLFYGCFCKEYYPKHPSLDISNAIVTKILNCDDIVTNQKNMLIEFVHMKPMIQGWKYPLEKWINQVGVYLTDDLHLLIGNFMQSGIFHYTDNDFVTLDILEKYKSKLKL